MSDLRRHDRIVGPDGAGLLMDLATTAPDGVKVVTRWAPSHRFTVGNQEKHARKHLNALRVHMQLGREEFYEALMNGDREGAF